MQLGMIGLGRMGGNMTERCMRGGHEMAVYDRNAETVGKYVEAAENQPNAPTGSAESPATISASVLKAATGPSSTCDPYREVIEAKVQARQAVPAS